MQWYNSGWCTYTAAADTLIQQLLTPWYNSCWYTQTSVAESVMQQLPRHWYNSCRCSETTAADAVIQQLLVQWYNSWCNSWCWCSDITAADADTIAVDADKIFASWYCYNTCHFNSCYTKKIQGCTDGQFSNMLKKNVYVCDFEIEVFSNINYFAGRSVINTLFCKVRVFI